jgi:hypothetical protein
MRTHPASGPGHGVISQCFLLAAATAALVAGPRISAATLQKDQAWFQTGFEETNALRSWGGQGVVEPGKSGGSAVAIASTNTSGKVITMDLPVDQVRGCMLRASALVRGDKVSDKPKPWNGVKCMLILETPSGKQYPQATIPTGSFDWQPVSFIVRIPVDAKKATLLLGLEAVSGKAWFDDIKITVLRPPRSSSHVAASPVMYKGHSLPRLRGTMISTSITPESLKTLGLDWNANLIRWQLFRQARPGETPGGYDEWLEAELKKLDAALPLCEKLGLYVVLDLHSPPGGKGTAGGYVGSDAGLFSDPASQDKFVEIWRKMATRYKDARPIWGYDLVNEPVEDGLGEGCLDWQGLAERAARAIREIDPERTIIVEPAAWGGPGGLEEMEPLSVSNVVYSVHMYMPHAFTHQNVHGKTPSYTYPGIIEGKYWNKAELERALQPAIDFQKRYNVHMYIGEFSAIRWAPGNSAFAYLSDLIDIFEQHGWDWTYHAFREWSGWSVEHGSDPKDAKPAASPTDRQKLLQDWFAKNQKPKW